MVEKKNSPFFIQSKISEKGLKEQYARALLENNAKLLQVSKDATAMATLDLKSAESIAQVASKILEFPYFSLRENSNEKEGKRVLNVVD